MSYFSYIEWAAIIGSAAVGLWAWEWHDRRARRRQELALRELGLNSMEPMLMAPDWEFYQSHLGRSVPPELRELYSRTDLVLSPSGADCASAESLNCFQPISRESLEESLECYSLGIVPIALSVSGDPLYLKPGDPMNAVYILRHDGGEAIHTPDVATFVNGLSVTPA
jgi:hypothetical protein